MSTRTTTTTICTTRTTASGRPAAVEGCNTVLKLVDTLFGISAASKLFMRMLGDEAAHSLGVGKGREKLRPIRGCDALISESVEVRAQIPEDVVCGWLQTIGAFTLAPDVLGNIFGQNIEEHGLEMILGEALSVFATKLLPQTQELWDMFWVSAFREVMKGSPIHDLHLCCTTLIL